ncbi:hypothetical protein RchiOBHm_Chr4g0403731 [Rosa chinensis]|uniref:Uncharacterized protein n=1 Tax=Rosa chinensis TaxID=74649 RepID=A0A2P6QTM9_ROSCH|nr:hypothetical protein RchiOBHm_Chr4g0403731 [Rosa chinensis]
MLCSNFHSFTGSFIVEIKASPTTTWLLVQIVTDNMSMINLIRSHTISLLPRQQEAKIVSFFGFQPTWKTSSLQKTEFEIKILHTHSIKQKCII